MIDVREFEVDVAYSVAKPTGMLEQKSRISNLESLLTTTSCMKNVTSKNKLNFCRTLFTRATKFGKIQNKM